MLSMDSKKRKPRENGKFTKNGNGNDADLQRIPNNLNVLNVFYLDPDENRDIARVRQNIISMPLLIWFAASRLFITWENLARQSL